MNNISNNEWQERVARAAAFLAAEAENLYGQRDFRNVTGMHHSAFMKFKGGNSSI